MLAAFRNFLKIHPALLSPMAKLYGARLRKYGCTLELHVTGTKLALNKGKRSILIPLQQNHHLRGIARNFEQFFDAVEAVPIGDRYVADFSESKIHYIPGLNQGFRFTFVPEDRMTNAAYLEALKMEPGDIVIDAGAYCGLTAYMFSLAVGPTGQVISIEADVNNFAALCENIDNTSAKNIRLVHAALWKESGVLQFQAEGTMSSTVLQAATRTNHMVDVPAVTLLDICEKFSLDRVDHVKMDIEGAEYEVVLSSAAFIAKYRPDFIIEAHQVGNTPVDVPKLANFFAAQGYQMVHVAQPDGDLLPLLHFTLARAPADSLEKPLDNGFALRLLSDNQK